MVREEEEPKKRSWFSRKKKPTNGSPHVSRPPSAASFPSHHRKTSSQSTLVDDDLPPREGKPVLSHSEASTPVSPSRTPTIEDASDIGTPDVSHLPKTAGFDLTAIKEIIGKADLNPEELQMPAPTRFHAPSIPPPTHRSESAPPPIPEEPSSPSPPISRSPSQTHDHPVASSSRTDLSATLSRSMSLNDMKAGLDDDEELTSSSEKTPSASQTFRAPAPLAFGGSDASFWPSDPDRLTPLAGGAFGTFGQSSLGTARPGGFAPRPHDSAFAPPESAGISFGGADGSITFMPSARVEPPDPWNISSPSFGGYSSKKASSSLNVSNPWQS